MKKNNDLTAQLVAKFAETSKIGIAGFFAGVFCLLFAIAYTIIHYSKRRE